MSCRLVTFALSLLAFLAGGCFHSDAHRSGFTEDGQFWSERVADRLSPAYIDELRDEILALGEPGEVDPGEARVLADASVRGAAALAKQYNMVRPIEVHNALVNLGLRRRGLCYQCAEDLYVRLRALNLRTLQLHWGVAHKFDLWLEHSGVIVTARGHPFSEGLVVDGWRHSGRLRWARVGHDRYPWVRMFKRNFPELREEAEREEAEREAGLAAARQRAEPPNDSQMQTRPESDQRVESRAAAVRAPEVSPSEARGNPSAIVTSPANPQ